MTDWPVRGDPVRLGRSNGASILEDLPELDRREIRALLIAPHPPAPRAAEGRTYVLETRSADA